MDLREKACRELARLEDRIGEVAEEQRALDARIAQVREELAAAGPAVRGLAARRSFAYEVFIRYAPKSLTPTEALRVDAERGIAPQVVVRG
jgi:hypothetical protein